jgi:Mlc titration factor MtfA (ptsG expression regulator)
MINYFWYIAVLLISMGVCCWVLRIRLRNKRRLKLQSLHFPDEWKNILKKDLLVYRLLPESLRNQLHGHINVFLHEKLFEGCGGLEVTDEIRVIIAAQACLLLLNRNTKYFPGLVSIVVYPNDYVVKEVEINGLVEDEVNSGESWQYGTIVLSWDAIMRHGSDNKHGHNVVLHEFAHQLDQEDGSADGIPILEQRSHYATWSRILSKNYEQLRKNAWKRNKEVLDYYGTLDPAEFFAVLTEAFFEKPIQLKANHPDLYEEMKTFYKVDPGEWYQQKSI